MSAADCSAEFSRKHMSMRLSKSAAAHDSAPMCPIVLAILAENAWRGSASGAGSKDDACAKPCSRGLPQHDAADPEAGASFGRVWPNDENDRTNALEDARGLG
jgi:hypothetical protein